uniref:Putative secreted protein n=1 Tax=Ixodes ricinus TaxID=34613 RepID=A0A6B0UEB6_IXORI
MKQVQAWCSLLWFLCSTQMQRGKVSCPVAFPMVLWRTVGKSLSASLSHRRLGWCRKGICLFGCVVEGKSSFLKVFLAFQRWETRLPLFLERV